MPMTAKDWFNRKNPDYEPDILIPDDWDPLVSFEEIDEASPSANKILWDKIKNKGVGPAIDKDEYPPIKGMEGPFRYKNGRILYYDPKEGEYYDRKTDMYTKLPESVDESASGRPKKDDRVIYDSDREPYVIAKTSGQSAYLTTGTIRFLVVPFSELIEMKPGLWRNMYVSEKDAKVLSVKYPDNRTFKNARDVSRFAKATRGYWEGVDEAIKTEYTPFTKGAKVKIDSPTDDWHGKTGIIASVGWGKKNLGTYTVLLPSGQRGSFLHPELQAESLDEASGQRMPSPQQSRRRPRRGSPSLWDTEEYQSEEGEPTNVVGSKVAGTTGEPPGRRGKTKVQRRKFAGCEVFEVDNGTYQKCIQGKQRYARWSRYFDYNVEGVGKEIRDYAYRYPGKSIVVQDGQHGPMCYLKMCNWVQR